MMPGMIVLPRASMRVRARRGSAPCRRGPIAVIRLPSTTIVPFSMTPAAGHRSVPAPSAIVMIRAPIEGDRAVRHVGLGGEADRNALRLGLVGLLAAAVEEREGAREIAREELGPSDQ